MKKNFNLSALNTIREPIQGYINNISDGLQKNINALSANRLDEMDYSYLPECQKMISVLDMIGLNSLAKTLLLVKDAVVSVNDNLVEKQNIGHVFDQCFVLVKNIESYINELVNGGQDQPSKLLDKYIALGNLIGLSLTAKDLFSPKFDFIDSEVKDDFKSSRVVNQAQYDALKQDIGNISKNISKNVDVLIKLFESYQVLNDTDDQVAIKRACKNILDNLQSLQDMKLSKSTYIGAGLQKLIVCASIPYFNDKFNDFAKDNLGEILDNLNSIKINIEDINNYVGDELLGKKTSSIKFSDDVLRENLFFAINLIGFNTNLRDMAVYKGLVSYFDFEGYFDLLESYSDGGVNDLQKKAIVDELDNSLAVIKQEVNVIANVNLESNYRNEYFKGCVNQTVVALHRFRKALDDINADRQFKDYLSSLFKVIDDIGNNSLVLTGEVLSELSMSIIWLEQANKNLIKKNWGLKERQKFEDQLLIQKNRIDAINNKESLSSLDKPLLDEKSKQEDAYEMALRVYSQIDEDLRKTEELLDEISRKESIKDKDLNLILEPLNKIKGIFLMLGNKDMSNIAKELHRLWMFVDNNGLDSISKDELNETVRLFTGLSMFVKESANGNVEYAKAIQSQIVKKDGVDRLNLNNSLKMSFGEGIDEHGLGDIESVNVVNAAVIDNVVVEPVVIVDEGLNVDKSSMETTANARVNENISDIINKAKIEVLNVDDEKSGINYAKFSEENDDLKDTFIEEVDGLFGDLDKALNNLSNNLNDINSLTIARRIFHTFKGSGGMVEIFNFSEMAKIVEFKLNLELDAGVKNLNSIKIQVLKDVSSKFKAWKQELANTGELFFNVQDEIDTFNKNYDGVKQILDVESVSVEDNIGMLIESVGDIAQIVDDEKVQEDVAQLEGEFVVPSDDTDEIAFIEAADVQEDVAQLEGEFVVPSDDIEGSAVVEAESVQEDVAQLEGEFVVPSDDIEGSAIVEAESVQEDVAQLEGKFIVPSDDADDLNIVNGTLSENKDNVEQVLVDQNDDFQEILEMCIEEIKDNLRSMSITLKSKSIDNQNIKYDLMRSAHTMVSLSKTAGFNNFAEIISAVEKTLLVKMERGDVFDEEFLKSVKSAVIFLENGMDAADMISEKDVRKYSISMIELRKDNYGEKLKALNAAINDINVKISELEGGAKYLKSGVVKKIKGIQAEIEEMKSGLEKKNYLEILVEKVTSLWKKK